MIAHRGDSSTLPEQTIEAFDLAIDHGADAIELDVVPTADGVLIARHENELSLTTDVADRTEFASKRADRTIEGIVHTGWFSENFTAAEVARLRAKQRFSFRSSFRDGLLRVPTFNDVLKWLAARRGREGRSFGLFVEIKHPTYFKRAGLDLAELLLRDLVRHGMDTREANICVMSFEIGVLKTIRRDTDLPLAQLIDAPESRPGDFVAAGDFRTYADLITPIGLDQIVAYADGIGPAKRLLESASDPGPGTLISRARERGLFVCPWTFRSETRFIAGRYRGDPLMEYAEYFALGADGVITDDPAAAVAARRNIR